MADIDESRINRAWGRIVDLMRDEFERDSELQHEEMAYALLECAVGVSADEAYRDFLGEALKEVLFDYENTERAELGDLPGRISGVWHVLN